MQHNKNDIKKNSLFLNPTRVCFGPKLYPHRSGLHRWQIQSPCAKAVHAHTLRIRVELQTHKQQVSSGCARASPSPRPLRNRIPHHHTLLHLAEFTKVFLQSLWRKKKHNAFISQHQFSDTNRVWCTLNKKLAASSALGLLICDHFASQQSARYKALESILIIIF